MHYVRRLLVCVFLLLFGFSAVPASAQGRCQFFNETGFQVCGRILEYWQQNGGLPVFGYPIGAQQGQSVEGKTLQVQSFERERMELHPENAAPYDVLLGRLGADMLERSGRDWKQLPKAAPSAQYFFHDTGHAIAPQFWGYWSGHGLEFDGQGGTSFSESLALFGMPLSEAAVETNPTNGQPYLMQWFERARFEFHPENAGTPYEILLGLLSSEQGGAAPAPPPPAALPATTTAIIDLVNRERAAAGCPPVVHNATLSQIALEHSTDMAKNDFFEHTGSDGRTPFQRMMDAGYNFQYAAENIVAGARSPESAMDLWMNSPGHRANILNCDLREIGVGYVKDPGDALNYGTYWTQDFGAR